MSIWKEAKYFPRLMYQQWCSSANLAENARLRLLRLIKHAYERVPYYRRLFDEHGIGPEDISTVDDLRKIPVLTKQVLQRESILDFLAQGVDQNQCVATRTSGSTGLPLTVFRTKDEEVFGEITYYRTSATHGVRPWHKRALIVSPTRIPPTQTERRWMRKEIYLDAGKEVQEQIEVLRAFQPHVIYGYNNSLKLLAHVLRQSNVKGLSPFRVFGFAELLDHKDRLAINETLGVEMVDLYAAAETKCIAWECSEHCGYHINSDTLVVEFIRDGKPAKVGEPGHIVVTPLFLYAMPLIRYDLGDVGIPMAQRCPCGRGLPLMEMIQGRTDDIITLPSGRTVPPIGTFARLFEKEPNILEFVVLQEACDHITAKIVVRAGNGSNEVQRVKHWLEDLVNHEATVKVEIVDWIDRGATGKMRRIISRVPVSF